jgi:hypothetical protein
LAKPFNSREWEHLNWHEHTEYWADDFEFTDLDDK